MAQAEINPTAAIGEENQVVVAIATAGRRGIARETVRHLASLRDHPDRVLLSIGSPDDFDTADLGNSPFPLEILIAEKGLCSQRNAILEAVPKTAVLLFIDDDFLLAEGYISATRNLFDRAPEVVMATGAVLIDGILGPGYSHVAGQQFLDTAQPVHSGAMPTEVYNGYGCNMAVRMATVAAHGLRFDLTLPYYGWLEDVDFSRQLAPYGQIVKDPNMQGVHLGTKVGRSRGVPLGYSQIANPVYLIRKGTMNRRRAYRLMIRNLMANFGKALIPDPLVDRRGRAKGNLLALRDLITGHLSPQRILDL
mgnify:CR=1 FL=1